MGKWRWGIVLDAGSSGTRIHIYQWLKPKNALEKASKEELGRLPKLNFDKEWVKKIRPGIATFGDKPDLVGPDHLHQLFDHARNVIPEEELENTPVFLLATAGMRLLKQDQRTHLLAEICNYAKKNTKFQLPDCDLHIQVIPGETEGLYGWIAANYLLGGFDKPKEHDHGKDHHTYGFLDMGGASAQIAFAPNSTETEKHANDLKLLRLRNVDGTPAEHKVFVTTWLRFGVNEARRRYVEGLIEASPDADQIPDPCLPSGLKITADGESIEPGSPEDKGQKLHLIGTGEFKTCAEVTKPLLNKNVQCLDPPCLLDGVHVPAIDFDVNHFIGVSEYWHTTHEIFEFAHKDKSYDYITYQKRVNEFCSMDWNDILAGLKEKQWGKKVTEKTALEVCFKASWIITVLHEGIGLPKIGHDNLDTGFNGTKEVLDKAKDRGFLEPFQAVNKIDGHEVSWTLGKMVLYAASEIPPADDKSLAVGFGTNEPNLLTPTDFQYGGGSPQRPGLHEDDTAADDWHETLFNKDSPRRIPGFIIFFLIVLLALFILCGRDRRSATLLRIRRILPGSSSKPRTTKRSRGRAAKNPLNLNLASKLFRSTNSGPAYERVLEDGGPSTTDFELPDLPGPGDYSDNEHSDSSDSSSSAARVGRTSGWATPQINKSGFFDAPAVPYFDALPAGSAAGSGPPSVVGNAISRGGLMARVDSRERLSALDMSSSGFLDVQKKSRGRGSRASSPSKLRSFKESLD